jgi:hypothetical protein
MKRVFAVAAVIGLVLALAVLHSTIKNFLWTHPWWHSFLVAVPTIALPILAYFELYHSGEANALRAKANSLQTEANGLQVRIADLSAELDADPQSFPIPNTEVKPCRADDTALETTREPRSPPGLNSRGRRKQSRRPFFFTRRWPAGLASTACHLYCLQHFSSGQSRTTNFPGHIEFAGKFFPTAR